MSPATNANSLRLHRPKQFAGYSPTAVGHIARPFESAVATSWKVSRLPQSASLAGGSWTIGCLSQSVRSDTLIVWRCFYDDGRRCRIRPASRGRKTSQVPIRLPTHFERFLVYVEHVVSVPSKESAVAYGLFRHNSVWMWGR